MKLSSWTSARDGYGLGIFQRKMNQSGDAFLMILPYENGH